MTPMKEETVMSVRMDAKLADAINQLPLWEMERDYREMRIFYVCEDGMAVDFGVEEMD